MGLSGMGDLVLTCTGDLSRNRQVGLRLAAGESLAVVTASMRSVAEGVPTTEAACALADTLGVDLPISRMTGGILAGLVQPEAAMRELMSRKLKAE